MPLLQRIQVTFRCLRDVDLDFTSPEDGSPSPFIALVGPNGAGKTTVLESIAIATRSILTSEREHPPNIAIELHFRGARLTVDGRAFESRTLEPGGFWLELYKILYTRSGYLPTIQTGKALEPGLAPRLHSDYALMNHGSAPRLHPDYALLAPPSSGERIAAVHQWWLRQHMEYPKTTNLDRLWKALEPFLGDLVYIGVNLNDHLPMFDARGTQVSFNELSSGERRIILLFLEIAMQCGEDGLVLFDEPEAHFHPKWQLMLRDALAKLLPRGQVIVATHSPHIVEGLPAHQLFVLGGVPW